MFVGERYKRRELDKFQAMCTSNVAVAIMVDAQEYGTLSNPFFRLPEKLDSLLIHLPSASEPATMVRVASKGGRRT